MLPIHASRKCKLAGKQNAQLFDQRSTQEQPYEHTAIINAIWHEVDKWRAQRLHAPRGLEDRQDRALADQL